jgi:hypothetical protein
MGNPTSPRPMTGPSLPTAPTRCGARTPPATGPRRATPPSSSPSTLHPGVHRHPRGALRQFASRPWSRSARGPERFGGYGEGAAAGLTLRHDHGSQFMSDDYQADIHFLGIASSPAYVRERNGTDAPIPSFAPQGAGAVGRELPTVAELLKALHHFQGPVQPHLAGPESSPQREELDVLDNSFSNS